MREHGYKRRRQGTYEKHRGDLVATVNFQRSVHNTKDCVEFTINLEVVNELIMREYLHIARQNYEMGTPKRLQVVSGSWSKRVGVLLSGYDHWWKLQLDQPMEPIVESVVQGLEETALPRIEVEMDQLSASQPSVVVIEDNG